MGMQLIDAVPEICGGPFEDDFSTYLHRLQLLVQKGFYAFCPPRKPRTESAKRLKARDAVMQFSEI